MLNFSFCQTEIQALRRMQLLSLCNLYLTQPSFFFSLSRP
ncbi:hypothetical protein AB09_1076 [Escherichia coli 8-415-05_S1_C1]|nr:hypothetical protein AB09_1076 [Escherichia coli 8-415-05_S1_C1]